MDDEKFKKSLELNKKWIQFLSLFFGGKIEIVRNPSNHRFSYKDFNLLDSDIDIDIDNSRGYISLFFKSEDDKQIFVELAGIKKVLESQKVFGVEYDKTIWTGVKNKYPCRIYLNPKTQLYPENINFYDLAGVEFSIDEELENRIVVLESILETVLRYRIKKIRN